VLTQGATTAAPLTLLGGRVAALGGYGTIDPVLTPSELAELVRRGETRFVALGGGYARNGGNAASTAVAHACTEIPAPSWRSPQNIGTPAHPDMVYARGGWNLILYDCAGRTAQLAAEHWKRPQPPAIAGRYTPGWQRLRHKTGRRVTNMSGRSAGGKGK